jgi:predicted RNA-binding protein with PUA-like domain
MNYWLVKTEPESYALKDLMEKGEDIWDGVRNHQARNFLEKMNLGDKVFVYHSGKQKAVVGMAEVSKKAFPDPAAKTDENWLAVNLIPISTFDQPVTLKAIKSNPALTNMVLVRQSRLSVMPVLTGEAQTILTMAKV